MSAGRTGGGPTLRIRQVGSGIGREENQKATLRALGLGKLGRVRVHPDNRQVRGMVSKIPHLVEILDEKASAGGKR